MKTLDSRLSAALAGLFWLTLSSTPRKCKNSITVFNLRNSLKIQDQSLFCFLWSIEATANKSSFQHCAVLRLLHVVSQIFFTNLQMILCNFPVKSGSRLGLTVPAGSNIGLLKLFNVVWKCFSLEFFLI